jgi:hypothetical protein
MEYIRSHPVVVWSVRAIEATTSDLTPIVGLPMNSLMPNLPMTHLVTPASAAHNLVGTKKATMHGF